MGGVDAVVFGGGIGEHSPDIRAGICQDMDWCGLTLDHNANAQVHGLPAGAILPIHDAASDMDVVVGGTDEEAWIGRETRRLLLNR
ncbi:MAG: hypothetical protein MRJ63_02710 [Nitrospirales bacterium]|nr:hypothetical protein [Nitrospirales bacterium]